jgi:hypothetical protein
MMFPKQGPRKKSSNRMTDKPHLRWLATLPCACCCIEDETIIAHHLMRNVVRGMGMKADDKNAIPLCHVHHSELHTSRSGETVYLASKGIFDAVELAEKLYAVSGDDYEGHRIIMGLHRS